jgi:DNA repair photolyase
MYREIQAKSALNKLKRKVPYRWDLNIFRGCEHACHYCYARYSHKYLGSEDFDADIYVKTNVVDVLSRELFCRAKQSGVDYALCGTLYLRGSTRNHFFSFLENDFPGFMEAYRKLYVRGGADARYKARLYRMVNAVRKEYGLSGSYTKPMKDKLSSR